MPQTRPNQCRHIHTAGHRCGSPALTDQHFCFYHRNARRPHNPQSLDLPMPEDRESIQLAIGLILQRIAAGLLDPKRAGLLLYGLQIASANLPPHPKAHAFRPHAQEFIEDEAEGLIAPPATLPVTQAEAIHTLLQNRLNLQAVAEESSSRPPLLRHSKYRTMQMIEEPRNRTRYHLAPGTPARNTSRNPNHPQPGSARIQGVSTPLSRSPQPDGRPALRQKGTDVASPIVPLPCALEAEAVSTSPPHPLPDPAAST